MSNRTKETKLEMEYDIHEYLSGVDAWDDPCNQKGCIRCPSLEECYAEAISRCNAGFAEAIDCGGYDTEEEFWEQLID